MNKKGAFPFGVVIILLFGFALFGLVLLGLKMYSDSQNAPLPTQAPLNPGAVGKGTGATGAQPTTGPAATPTKQLLRTPFDIILTGKSVSTSPFCQDKVVAIIDQNGIVQNPNTNVLCSLCEIDSLLEIKKTITKDQMPNLINDPTLKEAFSKVCVLPSAGCKVIGKSKSDCDKSYVCCIETDSMYTTSLDVNGQIINQFKNTNFQKTNKIDINLLKIPVNGVGYILDSKNVVSITQGASFRGYPKYTFCFQNSMDKNDVFNSGKKICLPDTLCKKPVSPHQFLPPLDPKTALVCEKGAVCCEIT
jgi:hypothetical protein